MWDIEYLKYIFIGIGFILLIVLKTKQSKKYSEKIVKYVESIGGTLISYERKDYGDDFGPFNLVGQWSGIYCITYEINGEKKEGWVWFRGLGYPDWRF